jgi:hypothetical protein
VHTMIQTKLVGLLVISLSVGFPSAYAAAVATNASTTESLDPHLPSQQASIATSTSQPVSSNVESHQKNAAPDCDGEAPSTASVPALLSRFVRSSTIARGVQCPIPPIPNQSTEEELHP